MPVSTLLKYSRVNLRKMVQQLLGAGPQFRAMQKKFCSKAGVPGATDTPIAKGDMCINTSANTLYVNTTYDAGGASNVWTQIV